MGSNKECVHLTRMHWRHRFPMLFIKLSDTGIGSEDQTQSLEIELAIPFVPNRDPQILLNNPSSVRSCIIIHQNEVVTNNGNIWADAYGSRISSRYLRPVTVPPWNTCRSVWPPSEIPAQTGIPPRL
ncbi:hypothetical protein TNCV_647031 [Trichonephila clavipes]|uniref:Uncharacterized protein n=1 Tax=Trichonephila clavipes TaxID=2585209 RepID=A0A8X6VJ29_TRICX|nr:hypothetical protein TNCV_647031 [Trichonephila clavipes]